ncbi:MAG: DMT family transporter [Pseudomonadota bacterium]
MTETTAEATESKATGYLLLIAIGLFWGLNWPAMKIGLTEITVWWFRTISLAGGAFGILGIVWATTGKILPQRSEIRSLLLCTVFIVLGWHIFTAYGVSLMPAGRASIIAYLMPVFAAVLAVPVLREPLTRAKLLGLALGMAGLAMLIGPDIVLLQTAPIGALFMVAAAASWGLGTVLFKGMRWTSSIALVTGWQLLFGLVVIFPVAALTEPVPDLAALSAKTWIALAYLIALPMIFCQWAYLKVVTIFPAAVAAIGTLAVPVVGTYSSALILAEPIGWPELSALILITAALVVVLVLPAIQAPRARATG